MKGVDKIKTIIQKKLYQLFYVFCHRKFSFCLLCKETLSEYVDENLDYLIAEHLLCEKHEESAEKLFKLCVPGCEVYTSEHLDVIRHSVFDIPMILNGESSFVCEFKDKIFCMICQENISACSDDYVLLKRDLINHLDSELHLNNIRNNVCWVYRFNTSMGFVMFHKYLLHCSLCEQTLYSKENVLLQTVVDHVEKNHFHERLKYSEGTINFLSQVFHCLPDYLKINQPYIVLENNRVLCILCSCYTEILPNDIFESAILLNDHLLTTYHSLQYNSLSQIDVLNSKEEQLYFYESVKSALMKDFTLEASKVKEETKDNLKLPLQVQPTSKNIPIDNSSSVGISGVNSLSKMTKHIKLTNNPDIDNIPIKNNILSIAKEKTKPIPSADSSHKHLLLNVASTEACNNIQPLKVSSLFKGLPDVLKVHKTLFSVMNNRISCDLCCIALNNTDKSEISSHITSISHKTQFLAKIKRNIQEDIRSHVKYLIFISRQLYCSMCCSYILPWEDFKGICQAVVKHFYDVPHQTLSNKTLKSVVDNKCILQKQKQAVSSKFEYHNQASKNIAISHSPIDFGNNFKIEEKLKNFINHSEISSPKTNDSKYHSRMGNGLDTAVKNSLRNEVPLEGCDGFTNLKSKKLEYDLEIQKSSTTKNKTLIDCLFEKLNDSLQNSNSKLANESKSNSKQFLMDDPDCRDSQSKDLNKNTEQPYRIQSGSSSSNKETIDDPEVEACAYLMSKLEKNIQFIKERGSNFHCLLCNKGISFSPVLYILASNFKQHFDSSFHVINLQLKQSLLN